MFSSLHFGAFSSAFEAPFQCGAAWGAATQRGRHCRVGRAGGMAPNRVWICKLLRTHGCILAEVQADILADIPADVLWLTSRLTSWLTFRAGTITFPGRWTWAGTRRNGTPRIPPASWATSCGTVRAPSLRPARGFFRVAPADQMRPLIGSCDPGSNSWDPEQAHSGSCLVAGRVPGRV